MVKGTVKTPGKLTKILELFGKHCRGVPWGNPVDEGETWASCLQYKTKFDQKRKKKENQVDVTAKRHGAHASRDAIRGSGLLRKLCRKGGSYKNRPTRGGSATPDHYGDGGYFGRKKPQGSLESAFDMEVRLRRRRKGGHGRVFRVRTTTTVLGKRGKEIFVNPRTRATEIPQADAKKIHAMPCDRNLEVTEKLKTHRRIGRDTGSEPLTSRGKRHRQLLEREAARRLPEDLKKRRGAGQTVRRKRRSEGKCCTNRRPARYLLFPKNPETVRLQGIPCLGEGHQIGIEQ